MYPGHPIRAGARDEAAVRAIQARLNALGVRGIDGDGPIGVDGVFGPETEAAVRLFQARSLDARGNPLEIDGVVGPMTWAALFDEAWEVRAHDGDDYLGRVLGLARSQVGVCEDPLGSNDGRQVRAYLNSVGVGPGYAWCAAFVYWCFHAAADGEANPAPRTGGVHDMWSKAGRAGQLRYTPRQAQAQPELVRPGQLFFLDSGGGLGHVGFIAEVSGVYLTTIEGNTTDVAGSREGIGVFERHARKIGQINLGFADFTRQITDA